MNRMFPRLLLCCALLTPSALVRADDIEDALKEALEKYKEGDYGAASQSLQLAQSMIDDKSGDQVKELLPAPPSGWEAEEAEVNKMGLLGGGVSVSRNYTSGEKNLKITVTKGSPLVTQFAAMFSNPAMAGAMGMKVKKIQGETAMYQVKDGNATMNLLIAGTVLVQLEGSGPTEAELLDFAGKLDLAKLKKLN